MNSKQATDSSKSHQHTTAFLNRGALLVAAVLTAGSTMAAAQPGLHQVTPASAATTSVGAVSAYGPGGSVYDQQVPAAGRITDVPQSYFPGGSVYRSQVPREAW